MEAAGRLVFFKLPNVSTGNKHRLYSCRRAAARVVQRTAGTLLVSDSVLYTLDSFIIIIILYIYARQRCMHNRRPSINCSEYL